MGLWQQRHLNASTYTIVTMILMGVHAMWNAPFFGRQVRATLCRNSAVPPVPPQHVARGATDSSGCTWRVVGQAVEANIVDIINRYTKRCV